MTHDELVASYGDKYGLADFRLIDGLARLDMGEGIDVYVESREDSLLLHTGVGVEKNPDPRLLRHMLGANLFFAGKNHAALAMDPGTGDVLLLLGVDSGNLDVYHFELAVAELVAEAGYWREFLSRGKTALDELALGDVPAAPVARPIPGMMA